MRARLPEPRACHPHKDRLFLKFFDGIRAAVTHTGLQTPDELCQHFTRFATIGDRGLN